VHATLCDIVTDIVQNSIEAGASQVTLEVSTNPEKIEISISDDGKGMDEETLSKAFEPFYSEAGKHDHRRVGLGLPLLKQTAEATDGGVEIQSEPGKGTRVKFHLSATHWDTPPLGNLVMTVLGLMSFRSGYNLTFTRRTPQDSYQVSRHDLMEALGNLEEAATLILAKEYLTAQENELVQSEERC
jgi:Histidine kinase-, DNA gyrase B-, and HSP90-like ATPase